MTPRWPLLLGLACASPAAPPPGPFASNPAQRMLRTLDLDQDGRLGLDELRAPDPAAAMAAADANGDGFIDLDELDRALSQG